MNPDDLTPKNRFVRTADEGQAFWFLNTLTINKVGAAETEGRLSIVDHRVPPGFAPPPHIHQASDETFLVLEGEVEGFCGNQAWTAGPARWCSCQPGSRTDSRCRKPGRAGSS